MTIKRGRPSIPEDKRYQRLNITLPRELLDRFRPTLQGKPLSQAIAEMMAKRLSK
jgi:hypothetical protein